MDDKTKTIIRKVALEVIKEEGFQAPDKITFKNNLFGTKKCGSILKNRFNNSYMITINLNKRKFIKDDNGKYHDKIGNRYRRVYGEKRPLKENVNTVAHEIAHLRFWAHSPSHLSYTNYLNKILIEKLKREEVDVNGNGDTN